MFTESFSSIFNEPKKPKNLLYPKNFEKRNYETKQTNWPWKLERGIPKGKEKQQFIIKNLNEALHTTTRHKQNHIYHEQESHLAFWHSWKYSIGIYILFTLYGDFHYNTISVEIHIKI